MGSERTKAVKPVEKKVTPPPPPPLFATPPVQAGGPAGGNALAALQAIPIGYVQSYSALDPIEEDNALAAALASHDLDTAVAILARNATPRAIYALIQDYETHDMISQLWRASWSPSQWARVQAYLGDQLPLNLQIKKHAGDRDAVFRDLQRIPDEQALGLFLDAAGSLLIAPKPTEQDEPPPAYTTRDLVVEAMHEALSGNDYYQAMRLLLQKASRAQQVHRATPVAPGLDLGMQGGPFAIVSLPSTDDASQPELFVFDVVEQEHVELVLEIVHEADAKNWDEDRKARSRAYLALADLNTPERRLAANGLERVITNNVLEIGSLRDILAKGDVEAVHTLIVYANYGAGMLHQDVDATTLDFAIERAGALISEARANVDATAPDTPERKEAQAKADQVTGTLLDWDMMAALRRDPDRLEARLKTLGAPPLQIGIELLQQTSSSDFDAVVATVRRIDASVRVEAFIQSGFVNRLPDMTDDQREELAAYLTVGREPLVHPSSVELHGRSSTEYLMYWNQDPPSQLPYVVPKDGPQLDLAAPAIDPTLLAAGLYVQRPRTAIAIADILAEIDRGQGAAAVSRIRQLNSDDVAEVYADKRIRAAIDNIDDNEVKDALHDAWWDAAGESYVLAERSHNTQAIFEAAAASGDAVDMRRGFVLSKRLAANPTLQLSDHETSLVRAYQIALEKGAPLSGWQDKETYRHLIFGQPGFGTGADSLDPTTEAEFMMYRIDERAGARDPSSGGQQLEDKVENAGPNADEAVARFRAYYLEARDGGFTPGELAQLAERYHEAMRALDKFQEDNVSFAHKVAKIVGAVVVTVIVIAATGGGATPFVIGALAALGGGAAEAATGAAIRTESSLGQVATDFAGGTVDGIAMAAGNELGAAAVEAMWGGEAAGVAAGELAPRVGAAAMRKVSRGFFATIVENAIAGAVANSASEVFETAADKVTWDRGIAEAFAKILAAAARGAATGAVMGGVIAGGLYGLGALGSVVAKLATRNSPEVATGIARMLEASGAEAALLENLAETSEAQLVQAYKLIEAGRIDEAERLIDQLELPASARAGMIEFARARVALRAVRELGGLPEGAEITPNVLNKADYEAVVGNQRGDAATIIRDGRPMIVVKAGAAPSVIREEIVHVVQFYSDPVMRARMLLLSEDNLANWGSKQFGEKVQIYAAKLEVEADAQRRILALLEEDAASGDPEAQLRELDAQETLNKLDEKLAAVRDATDAGALDKVVPEEPPWLFGKGAQTRPSKKAAAAVKKLVTSKKGLNVNNPKDLAALDGYGYVPGKSAGKIFRLSRTSEATDVMPHLQVEADGKVVIGERPTFAEVRADAEQQWRSTADDINSLEGRLISKDPGIADIARAQKSSLAFEFQGRLAKLVQAKQLDEASAGMLLKWGNVIEAVDERVGGAAGKRLLDEVVAQIPEGSLTEVQVDEFRRLVREKTVDYLESIRSLKQRNDALRDMLALQPDPSSQGALFTAYRREVLLATDESAASATKLFGPREQPIEVFKLPGGVTRTPDDAVTLAEDLGKLKQGRYALEDKAGKHAFRMDQARDYARALAKGKSGYDGLIYVFSTRAEADAAITQLRNDVVTASRLGLEESGIHISFFNPKNGQWELAQL